MGKKRLVYYPSSVPTSKLKSRGVRIEEGLWRYVEAYAYENRIGKTDAFNMMIRAFMDSNPVLDEDIRTAIMHEGVGNERSD